MGNKADANSILLVFFNIIVFLFGAAIIAFGIWFFLTRMNPDTLQFDTSQGVLDAIKRLPLEFIFTVVLLAAGALVLLISFVGCCAACCKNRCCLGCYSVIMIVLILVAVLVLIFTFLFRAHGAIPGVNVNVLDTLKTDYVPSSGADRNKTQSLTVQSVDLIQKHFKCCGIDGPQDYDNSLFYNRTEKPVPQSCCDVTAVPPQSVVNPPTDVKDVYIACQNEAKAKDKKKSAVWLFLEGCRDSFREWLDQRTGMVIGVGIAFIGCCIFGFILSCCVCTHLRKDY